MSRAQATRRASEMSSRVQQRPVRPESEEWSHSCIERPMTSCPSSFSRRAATEESTPPDIATAMRIERFYASSEGLTRLRHDEHEGRAADGELSAVVDQDLADPPASDEGAARRAQVQEPGPLVPDFERRVLAGDLSVLQDDVGSLAADYDAPFLDRKDPPRLRTRNDHQGDLQAFRQARVRTR